MTIKKSIKIFAFLITSCGFFVSCDEEFVPDFPLEEEEIVVEGYIEAGEVTTPPYVLLSHSVAFYDLFRVKDSLNFFIHDARITVDDGFKTVELSEVCTSDLSSLQKQLISQWLGFNIGINKNFCFYTDTLLSMVGQVGRTYDLKIEVEGQVLKSSTSIPSHVPLDSIRFTLPIGDAGDKYKLLAFFQDPANQLNFYRYQTNVNNTQFLSNLTSILTDELYNGKYLDIPIVKGEQPYETIDPTSYGLFFAGDSLIFKWSNIDGAHYDFWNTLEYNSTYRGPFSSYTNILSNIEGGLGIWGGVSNSYYRTRAPE